MDSRVIVLFGVSRAGKDTIGGKLAPYFSSESRECLTGYAFADPVKKIAEILFGYPRSISCGPQDGRLKFSAYGRNGREIVQWIGTDVGREQVHPDVWVDYMARRIHEQSRVGPDDTYIITDGRFPNERDLFPERLQALGYTGEVFNILIVRPGLVPDLSHESEQYPWRMTEIGANGDVPFGMHAVLTNDLTPATDEAVAHLAEMIDDGLEPAAPVKNLIWRPGAFKKLEGE